VDKSPYPLDISTGLFHYENMTDKLEELTTDPDKMKLTSIERKIVDASLTISEAEAENPEFLHSVLCQVGLPRSPMKGQTSFERTSGQVSMLIEAGKLYKAGKWQPLPLPYGSKPRLVLIHACSEAVRTKSPVIEVGNSVTEFLKKLNLDTTGRGFQLFRNQMEALAACRMTIGMSTATKSITIDTKPVERFEAWLNNTEEQDNMWPGVLELSPKFYETLTAHAMPLDPRALRALQSSALALDVYTWLANRLCRVRDNRGTKVSWANLKQQFGHEYNTSKDFKKAFKIALKRVLCVYPDAKIGEEIGGLRLYSSPPPIKKTKVMGFLAKK